MPAIAVHDALPGPIASIGPAQPGEHTPATNSHSTRFVSLIVSLCAEEGQTTCGGLPDLRSLGDFPLVDPVTKSTPGVTMKSTVRDSHSGMSKNPKVMTMRNAMALQSAQPENLCWKRVFCHGLAFLYGKKDIVWTVKTGTQLVSQRLRPKTVCVPVLRNKPENELRPRFQDPVTASAGAGISSSFRAWAAEVSTTRLTRKCTEPVSGAVNSQCGTIAVLWNTAS